VFGVYAAAAVVAAAAAAAKDDDDDDDDDDDSASAAANDNYDFGFLQVRGDASMYRGVCDDLLLLHGRFALVRHALLRLARDFSRAGHTT
jgi:hypothetical protein